MGLTYFILALACFILVVLWISSRSERRTACTDLLECPSCGEKHLQMSKRRVTVNLNCSIDMFSVECPSCLLSGPDSTDESGAEEVWEDRHPRYHDTLYADALSCPFCGEPPKISKTPSGLYWASCGGGCGAAAASRESRAEAFKIWNQSVLRKIDLYVLRLIEAGKPVPVGHKTMLSFNAAIECQNKGWLTSDSTDFCLTLAGRAVLLEHQHVPDVLFTTAPIPDSLP